jgi:hypothetical protein
MSIPPIPFDWMALRCKKGPRGGRGRQVQGPFGPVNDGSPVLRRMFGGPFPEQEADQRGPVSMLSLYSAHS